MPVTIAQRADRVLIQIIEDTSVPVAQRLKAIAELTKRQTKPARPIKDTNQAQAPIITGPSNVLGTR